MDDDRLTLIRELCVRAGMVLEDAATTAVLIGDVPPEALMSTISLLREMLERATAVLRGAEALAE